MKTGLLIAITWLAGLICGAAINATIPFGQNLATIVFISVPASLTILIIAERLERRRKKDH